MAKTRKSPDDQVTDVADAVHVGGAAVSKRYTIGEGSGVARARSAGVGV